MVEEHLKECEDCRKGNYNLCKNIRMLAIPGERDGVNAEYCVHDASMCYKLPDNMDTLEGALIEPLAVGMHATELSNAKVGETAIVLGSGCIGLCTIMSLKARGVSRDLCCRRNGQTSGKGSGSRRYQEYLTVNVRALKNLPKHFREAAQIRFTNVRETELQHFRPAD